MNHKTGQNILLSYSKPCIELSQQFFRLIAEKGLLQLEKWETGKAVEWIRYQII